MGDLDVATVEERRSRIAELKAEVSELNQRYAGAIIDEDSDDFELWNRLNTEIDDQEKAVEQIEARRKRVEELAEQETAREATGPSFQTARAGRVTGEDIYDLSTIGINRFSDPAGQARELRDRGKRAIEQAVFGHDEAQRDADGVRGHIERLLETRDTEEGDLALHLLKTGSPAYKRAFGKRIAGVALSSDEERALSTTTTAGGFAVPFALDPTIIPTSNLSVNPYRAIGRVEQITVSKWEGVSSAGVTAAFSAEATQSSDNAPTIAQPTVTPAKAQAFIPFSIEIGQDWGGLQTEMARLLQDAKDDLEADRFTLGTASTPEPEGILVGGTATVSTAGTAAFVVGDLSTLENALGPRFRPRASIIGSRATYNRVRAFDSAGGAALWVRVGQGLGNQVPTPGAIGNTLLGYPAYEASAYTTAITSNSLILTIGDFNYFLIVDRIGMNIELIPHLVGANQRPTGQRGLYAYWRTGSVVLSPNAFRTLKVL